MKSALEYDLPIIYGIAMGLHIAQADERSHEAKTPLGETTT